MKKIVLAPNPSKDPSLEYTKRVASLLIQNGFSAAAEGVYKQALEGVLPLDGDALYRDADAMVVLGGDGSILRSAKAAAQYGIPILAVNLGRLGYIAQLERDDLARLPEILSSDFHTEERAMLSVSLYREGEVIYENLLALNDTVITKAHGHGIIEFDLSCNGERISHYRGDGMIASTATGSTAYAMSAGGAVIDSSLRLIEITPICAHSLKARPIVFSGSAVLCAEIFDSPGTACVTLDGDCTTLLQAGDKLYITLSEQVTRLVSVDNSFCRVLFRKMSDL